MSFSPVGWVLMGVSAATNIFSAAEQSSYSDEAKQIQDSEIRNQQVQLRIQEAQSSTARLKNLQRVISSQEVIFGARNISPQSGSVRAIFNQDINNFDQDDQASKLNYMAKQSQLAYQEQGVDLEASARKSSAWLGAATGIIGSAMGAAKIPSGNLLDASKGSGSGGDSASGGDSGADSGGWQDSGAGAFDVNA